MQDMLLRLEDWLFFLRMIRGPADLNRLDGYLNTIQTTFSAMLTSLNLLHVRFHHFRELPTEMRNMILDHVPRLPRNAPTDGMLRLWNNVSCCNILKQYLKGRNAVCLSILYS